MFLNKYSIVKIAVSPHWFFLYSSSLLSILYEYYMKKEAQATEKVILANIPCLHAKSQAKSLAWHKLPALWATWRPGKLTGQKS